MVRHICGKSVTFEEEHIRQQPRTHFLWKCTQDDIARAWRVPRSTVGLWEREALQHFWEGLQRDAAKCGKTVEEYLTEVL